MTKHEYWKLMTSSNELWNRKCVYLNETVNLTVVDRPDLFDLMVVNRPDLP